MDWSVIVTGASAGIGAAIVEVATGAGAEVATLSRRPLDGTHLAIDLSQPSEWGTALTFLDRVIAGAAGEVWLVHMAGTLDPIGFSGEVDAESYRRHVLLNAAAPQVLGDGMIRALDASGRTGGLVMALSGAASTVYPGWSAYGAAKAAVEQWVRVVAEEREQRGSSIRVLGVSPGTIETAMQESIRRTPPSDFPKVATFLERDRSGANRSPEWAAQQIWRLMQDGTPGGASVVDLRRL